MERCKYCRLECEWPCDSENEARGCEQFKRVGALAAAKAGVTPPAEKPRFKLSDLSRVGELKCRLDYLETVRKALTLDPPRVLVERIDLRPELVARVVGPIEQAVDAEAANVRADLADLGVEV